MTWNPLATLAGRMALVAMVAVIVSQGAAVLAFTWERGQAMRSLIAGQVARQITESVTTLRQTEPSAREAWVTRNRRFGQRAWLSGAPAVPASTPLSSTARELVTGVRAGLPDGTTVLVSEGESRPLRRKLPGERGEPAGERPRDSLGGPGEGLGQKTFEPPPPDSSTAVPFDKGPGGGPDRVGRGPGGIGIGAAEAIRFTTLSLPIDDTQWLNIEMGIPESPPVPMEPLYFVFATALLVALVTGWTAARVGKPLRVLAASADRFGRGEGFAPALETGPEDIRQAATAFNTMAANLQAQLDRQRRTLWALSHDLRTPLTALRIRTELLDDEDTRNALQRPIRDMERLTEDALSLARAGARTAPLEEIDFAEMVADACQATRGCDDPDAAPVMRFEYAGRVPYTCRPGEMHRALQNLIQNAKRHGGGGRATLREEADGGLVFVVEDDGPGVPTDALERLTEPFFRTDGARSTEGSGLGLAIARAIVETHGGELALENRQPHGLRARITLPATRDQV